MAWPSGHQSRTNEIPSQRAHIYLIGRLYDLGIEPWRDVAWLPKNAAIATRTPVMTSEFLSLATFVLIFIFMYFVIKIFNMVKNSQENETGNETAVAENTRANQRASTAARDFNNHYPGVEGISNQCVLRNDRILEGTPAIRRLPCHNDDRFQ